MFADSVVLRKLDAWRESEGWLPTYYSPEEVEKWCAHLDALTETDAKGHIFLRRELNKREKAFIQNERTLAAIDCGYWLTRYYKISADNRIMQFGLRSGQKAFWRILQELDEAGQAKEIQCLKARQQGISTLIEGIATWYSLYVPGVKSLIASADGQKSQIMMGMMLLAIEQLPWWLTPTQTRSKTASDRAILEFSNIGSLIMVQSGAMKGGAGQGTTPTVVHLSEVCDWTDPVVQLEEGLFKAVHATSADIFMVLESTGNGNTGWWADMWRRNKEFYWQGRSRLLPVFLPWFMTPELFPAPNWIQKFPIPGGWKPNAETMAHAKKCEAYVASTPTLQKILGKNWRLPDTQAWFWEFNYLDAKDRRVEKSWLRQMPADDFEALQGHNDMVFGTDDVIVIESGVAKPEDIKLYGVVGEGIEERNEPPQESVWYGEDAPKRHVARWKSMKGEEYEWMMVPLLRAGFGKAGYDPMRKLHVFEEPLPDYDYSVGVDTGTGVGGDRSVACVSRTGHGETPDYQVAEFAADDIGNVEFYAWVAAITAWYGKFMERPRHPKLIIEQKRKYGDTCQHQLRLMGMKRMHEFVRYDKKTFVEKVGPYSSVGWFTNAWSRPMLLSAFKDAVANGWYVVRSPWLAQELKEQEQRVSASGLTRMDHASGKHDDRIFAAAMSYFTQHHRDVMAERSKKRYNSRETEKLQVDLRPYAVEMSIGGGGLWG